MKKVCPRCSTAFVCREDRIDLCQCSRVSLGMGVRDYIKDSYSQCLCAKCLRETNVDFHSFGVNPRYSVKK